MNRVTSVMDGNFARLNNIDLVCLEGLIKSRKAESFKVDFDRILDIISEKNVSLFDNIIIKNLKDNVRNLVPFDSKLKVIAVREAKTSKQEVVAEVVVPETQKVDDVNLVQEEPSLVRTLNR